MSKWGLETSRNLFYQRLRTDPRCVVPSQNSGRECSSSLTWRYLSTIAKCRRDFTESVNRQPSSTNRPLSPQKNFTPPSPKHFPRSWFLFLVVQAPVVEVVLAREPSGHTVVFLKLVHVGHVRFATGAEVGFIPFKYLRQPHELTGFVHFQAGRIKHRDLA